MANVLLFMEMVPGISAVDDLAPPGGMATLLVGALAIGVVAGSASARGRESRARSRIAFWVALLLSILAVALLLYIGTAAVPELWLSPNPARNL